MLVSLGETYELTLIKRKENSAYEYESTEDVTFMGRPAGTSEKREYRIQQGVNSSSDSIYILSSNLPTELKVGDHIKYIGKIWTVSSVGYYFESNRMVNASVMNNDYIIAQCPKGITLQ